MADKKNIVVILGDPRISDPVKFNGRFNPEDIDTVDRLKKALRRLKRYNFSYLNDHATLFDDFKDAARTADLFLNLCDEGFMNNPLREAEIPEELERLGIPYTGAGPACLRLCYNKSDVKKIAAQNGVPVSKGFLAGRDEIPEGMSFPMFVKPNLGDGSFGINEHSLVTSYDGLDEQIRWVRGRLSVAGINHGVLVEEYLPGPELTAAIIGNPYNLEVRLIQEDFGSLENFNIYDAKWNPDSPNWTGVKSIEPTISKEQMKEIREYSKYLFKRLGCRDYARFDWRLDKNGKPRLLEANPNCGWCYDGHLAKAFMIGKSGNEAVLYSLVLRHILHAAEKRMWFKI